MSEVESTINSIIPDKSKRKIYFTILLEVINLTDSFGSNKWGIYYLKDRIRFLIGNLIVFTISNRGIWIALDKERLKKDQVNLNLEQWRWDIDDYPEYSVIPSKNGFYNPSKDLSVWTLLKKYHFDYIKKATQKYEWLNIRSQKNHSSELLNYLREFLKCDIPEPNYNNPIDDLEEFKVSYISLSKTEQETVVQSRVGQGRFRNNLINYWKGCAVTGCNIISLLRASHIKPWRDCNNEERLDTYNGLLLIPNLDSAFDNGLISFNNEGFILISNKLDKKALKKLGINEEMMINKIDKRHKQYLEYHRKEVFLK